VGTRVDVATSVAPTRPGPPTDRDPRPSPASLVPPCDATARAPAAAATAATISGRGPAKRVPDAGRRLADGAVCHGEIWRAGGADHSHRRCGRDTREEHRIPAETTECAEHLSDAERMARAITTSARRAGAPTHSGRTSRQSDHAPKASDAATAVADTDPITYVSGVNPTAKLRMASRGYPRSEEHCAPQGESQSPAPIRRRPIAAASRQPVLARGRAA
jgi:hypothetical protein